jgi:hypothetical protein
MTNISDAMIDNTQWNESTLCMFGHDWIAVLIESSQSGKGGRPPEMDVLCQIAVTILR